MERYLVIPMTFYVFHMFALAIYNFRVRLNAVRTKGIHHSYLKIYQGTAPEYLITVGRHYDHQFQLPLLFFIVCVAHLSLRKVNEITLTLTWLFIVTRLVHTYIHLGSNKVPRRAAWFAAGWTMVIFLWLQLLYFYWI